ELALERVDAGDDLFQFIPEIEAQVERDLIVAAARGMKLAAGGPDALDQAPLDVHMNVFVGGGEAKLSVVDLAANRLEPPHDAPRLARRDDALACEHARVRDAAGDVVAVKPRVDVDRGGERLDRAGGRGGEAAAPQLTSRFFVEFHFFSGGRL